VPEDIPTACSWEVDKLATFESGGGFEVRGRLHDSQLCCA